MPEGKPAGVTCIHLSDDLLCRIFDSPDRPAVCNEFKAEELICGASKIEAEEILSTLENGI
jgi:hypothetical protein